MNCKKECNYKRSLPIFKGFQFFREMSLDEPVKDQQYLSKTGGKNRYWQTGSKKTYYIVIVSVCVGKNNSDYSMHKSKKTENYTFKRLLRL